MQFCPALPSERRAPIRASRERLLRSPVRRRLLAARKHRGIQLCVCVLFLVSISRQIAERIEFSKARDFGAPSARTFGAVSPRPSKSCPIRLGRRLAAEGTNTRAQSLSDSKLLLLLLRQQFNLSACLFANG